MFVVIAGAMFTFIGAAVALGGLRTNPRETVSADDLAKGRWPSSNWVLVKGEPDAEAVVWVKEYSTRHYIPVWGSDPHAKSVLAFVDVPDGFWDEQTVERIRREGAEGVVVVEELPPRAREEFEKEGLLVGSPMLVVVYQRVPWTLVRDGAVLMGVGLVILAAGIGLWRWGCRKERQAI